MRLTSARENADYEGQYYKFRNLTVLPRPVQQPLPIWVVSNPQMNKPRNVESGYRRVARLGDGWMTTFKPPADVSRSLEMIRGYAGDYGRTLGDGFEVCVYHNINVNENRESGARGVQTLPRRLLRRRLPSRRAQVVGRDGLAGRMYREHPRFRRGRRHHDHAPPHGLRSARAIQARDRGRPAGLRLELTRAMDRARSCQRQIGRRHDPRPSKPDRQAGAIVKPARSRPSGLRGSPRTP